MTLEQLQQLCDGATTGPWERIHIYDGEEVIVGPQTEERPNYVAIAVRFHDAELIVEARTWLPKLIAVAKAAKDVTECIYVDGRPWGYEELNKALDALEETP